jgi:chromosome segregation ATPase
MYVSNPTRFALLILAGLAATPAVAQNREDYYRDQARRLQQSNRTLEQQTAQLEREKADLAARLASAEGGLASYRRKAEGSSSEAEALRQELETMRTGHAELTARLAETEQRLKDTTARLENESGERQRQEALAAERLQSVGQCETLNAKLLGEGRTLLDRYRDKGCFDSVAQGEPFTGLKQIEIENFIEDSRERLEEYDVRQALSQ